MAVLHLAEQTLVKPRNRHKDGQRQVVSFSVTPDSIVFLEKLDGILAIEDKSRSEWLRDQIVAYVSERMTF